MLLKALFYRGSLRHKALAAVVKRLGIFSYPTRLSIDAVDRPYYGYCVFNAATLAKALGHERISVIEFGVAYGSGLVNLEYHAEEARKHLGVNVDVYGFDTGRGLPAPTDYRDVPYVWRSGDFAMDEAAVRARLRTATLVLGDVAQTLPAFVEKYTPAPIGAIIIDLDFYSSTKEALRLFDLYRDHCLPRVYMYFDDMVGDGLSLVTEFTGEPLAINEFNQDHTHQKLCLITGVQVLRNEVWARQLYAYHDFEHRDYCKYVGA